MNRFLTRLIVVGYIAILAFIVHSVFWSLDDELLMTIISIIIQSAMILYLTISNWNEGKEKIISPGYFIVFGAGALLSILFYFSTKDSGVDDVAYYIVLLFFVVGETILDVFVFDPNKYRGKLSGKEIEVMLPYFDTSSNYFDYGLFEHTDSESNTILTLELSKVDDFISRTTRMLDLPQPLAEYFSGNFKNDISKLKKNGDEIVLKNNFKKFIYINKDESGEKLLLTFIK